MLTTGVDLPGVDTVVTLRRISSIALYIQIVGRGLRAYPGKTECAIFDYGENYRYGFIDSPQLDERLAREGGEARTKTCPGCEALNHSTARTCVFCGAEFLFSHVLSDHSHAASEIMSSKLRISVVTATKFTKNGSGHIRTHSLADGQTAVSVSTCDTDGAVGRTVVYERLDRKNIVVSFHGSM